MTLQADTSGTPPRVSVLMAAYNCAAYVGEAIDSVLAQTMPELELILVDDGSTDESPEIMARYAKQDARVVIHRQENRGIGGATNQALRLARAPYVAILDSDDTMAPERLALQADYLDRHADIAAVGSQWFTMNTRGEILGLDRQPTDPDSLFTLMFAHFALHHPTIMARKAALLACGGYDDNIKQGCMDYGLFFKLLLTGQRMTNLPYLLTRWRFNPSGATHGNARVQTEDCVGIRAKAFTAMAARDGERANQLALDLIRNFPAGSWFDEKVSQLIPTPAPSPALQRWRELAAQDLIPEHEAASVDWLHDEPKHAERLAALLRREGLPWLGQCVLGKAGRATMTPIDTAQRIPVVSATLALSLLIPTHAGDDELTTRVSAGLDALPGQAEVIVFSSDGTAIAPASLSPHPRLRVLPPGAVKLAWLLALSTARGEYIACLAPGCRHHPAFLASSVAALRSNVNRPLIYAPAELYYPDALDGEGNAVKDPSPAPRWTRQTLLGKSRHSLSGMVFRRGLLDTLPLPIEEVGRAADWALARSLLTHAEPLILPLHNAEFAPKVGLANHIMEVVTQRLVSWYLDTGRGCIPAPAAWSQLSAAQGLERLRALDARVLENKLCIHPGNVALIAEFAARFSRRPWRHPIINHLLVHHHVTALASLRKQHALAATLYAPWRLWLRGCVKARTLLPHPNGRRPRTADESKDN